MTVYLIHFDHKLSDHAQHYIGFAFNLKRRIEDHRTGRGARLMSAVNEAGIPWRVVRKWKGGRDLERQLKNRKDAPSLCPVCRREARKAMRALRKSKKLQMAS